MANVKIFERLPTTCLPKHYHLVLTTDIESFTFQAEVSIQVQVYAEIQRITLNAIELSFKKIILKSDEGKVYTSVGTQEDIKNEIVEFIFSESIAPGNYVLYIEYTGEINDKMKGLYRSKYTNQHGKDRYAAVTQFAPIDARRCFPCWDEPAVKSTFDISLIVPDDLVALSNMSVKTQSHNKNGFKRYDFETSPIMSTYLVAIVIGKYDFVENYSLDGVQVHVYTPEGKKEQGLFALEVASKALPYYKQYFKVAYPLPKMDLIAIADCGFQAMENWGLITYRETRLLVDPENTSAKQKQCIALIIGHEIAHQWFGNLVTLEWWTHLWLNEGYASFVEFLCVDYLFPKYDIWTQFINNVYIKALELDSLKSSHPIEVKIEHPSDLDEIFDDISYNKGASILRMLHNYIGDADFRKGMHLYLTRYQFKNAATEDLWGALEEASKKPIEAVMSTWTKQMGFPLVTVSHKPASDGKGFILSLRQSKFCKDGILPTKNYTWMIPIAVCTSRNSTKDINLVLSSESTEIVVPDLEDNSWIKINPNCIGFYRTHYSSEMLDKFLPFIKDRSLPTADRIGLLNDLYALAQAGYTNAVEVLKLLQAYVHENDYNVWSCIISILTNMSMLLAYTDCKEAFKNFEKKILKEISQHISWDPRANDDHLDALLRDHVFSRMAWLDDSNFIEEAKARFTCHIGGRSNLPVDVRSACYKTVLRAGDYDTYQSLFNLYRSTDLHEEKLRICCAFGVISDETLLSQVLKFAMSEEVRAQDALLIIMSVCVTPTGRLLAWQFFKEHQKVFKESFQGGFLLTHFIKRVTEHFVTEEMAIEIETFFQENHFPGLERTIQQGTESIRINAAWLSRDKEVIKLFLKNFNCEFLS